MTDRIERVEGMVEEIARGQLPAPAQRDVFREKLVGELLQLPIDEALFIAASAPDWENTVSGLDYTKENGFMVFSAWYHLRRGYCCGNGCRYCPYPSSHKN